MKITKQPSWLSWWYGRW